MTMKLRKCEDYTEADGEVLWFDMRHKLPVPVYMGYKEDRNWPFNYSPPESIKWARVPALPVKCTVKMPTNHERVLLHDGYNWYVGMLETLYNGYVVEEELIPLIDIKHWMLLPEAP